MPGVGGPGGMPGRNASGDMGMGMPGGGMPGMPVCQVETWAWECRRCQEAWECLECQVEIWAWECQEAEPGMPGMPGGDRWAWECQVWTRNAWNARWRYGHGNAWRWYAGMPGMPGGDMGMGMPGGGMPGMPVRHGHDAEDAGGYGCQVEL